MPTSSLSFPVKEVFTPDASAEQSGLIVVQRTGDSESIEQALEHGLDVIKEIGDPSLRLLPVITNEFRASRFLGSLVTNTDAISGLITFGGARREASRTHLAGLARERALVDDTFVAMRLAAPSPEIIWSRVARQESRNRPKLHTMHLRHGAIARIGNICQVSINDAEV